MSTHIPANLATHPSRPTTTSWTTCVLCTFQKERKKYSLKEHMNNHLKIAGHLPAGMVLSVVSIGSLGVHSFIPSLLRSSSIVLLGSRSALASSTPGHGIRSIGLGSIPGSTSRSTGHGSRRTGLGHRLRPTSGSRCHLGASTPPTAKEFNNHLCNSHRDQWMEELQDSTQQHGASTYANVCRVVSVS